VTSRRITHVPGLDGLRGIGLTGVILFHYGLFFAPGWLPHLVSFVLGLQMFFVLSGALITSLLVSEYQRKGDVSLKAFYLRRSRRLGPAMAAVLPALLIVTLLWSGGSASQPLGPHPWFPLITVGLFVGNWVDFTSVSGGLAWLGPAWSLGIEEQYYLTWPTVLRFCLRRRVRRGSLYAGLAVACAISVVIAATLYHRYGYTKTYVASPTQLPCVLFGCALGYEIAVNPLGRLTRWLRLRTVGAIGLVGGVLTAYYFSHHNRFLLRGGYLPFAFFMCLLIGHCFMSVERPTYLTRFLGWHPFEIVGRVSYEAYLVHVMVIESVLHLFPKLSEWPMAALDTALIAAISGGFYYFVEQPIRRYGWKAYFSRRSTPALPASGITPPPSGA
jgi:peptidoglycan/LPS O-acetylase OafA/YrhL